MTSIVQGIVIGQQGIGDADIFVSLYTKEKGRMELLARGARKISSKLKSHIEPLNHIEVMVAIGRSSQRLAAGHSLRAWPEIRKNLDKTVFAQTLIEVAVGLIEPDEPDERIYNLFISWLSFLEGYILPTSEVKQFLLAWLAAWQLLFYLGYGPQVFSCARCRDKIIPSNHFFSIESGGLICSKCRLIESDRQISLPAVKILRYFLGADDLNKAFKDVARMNINDEIMSELNQLTRDFVEYTIGKPLKAWHLLTN